MEATKLNKVYLVIKIREKHSGGATWPEDFDLVCAYLDKEKADKHCSQLEREALKEEDDDLDVDGMSDDEVSEELYEFDDAPAFEVHSVELK